MQITQIIKSEDKPKRFSFPENIELRSESVQEILGRPPRWIIRWGITIIFVIVAGLVVGSYFFKYPDVLTATITVTTENLPAGIMAKTTGRIDTLFVSEKQTVQQGDILAVIENTACLENVLELKNLLTSYELQVTNGTHSQFSILNSQFKLGELQPAYQQFLKASEDYQYFIATDFHHKKIKVIQKQIQTQNLILQKAKTQLNLSSQQLAAVQQIFIMDSTLYAKNAISAVEFQNAKNSYLQQLQSYESAKLSIDNQNMSILQSEQSIFDLEQQRSEQLNNLQIALTGALNQLQTQITTWEQTYLLISPIVGVVTLTKYWQKNQNVSMGEVLVTVVPNAETKMVGKILLPPQGAGKVKEGQMVNVKFDNFPYMEFGMVRVQIKNISLVPVTVGDNQKAYMLEVEFPGELKTNYGKELTFSQEMTGTAEIITEDLRLLDKFLNPIKSVLKK
jgi:HlyD family secretion protein